MIKFEIKVLIKGSITYKGEKVSNYKIVDEYDMDLVRMAEEKLIKVKRIEISNDKNKEVKYNKKINKLE